MKIVWTLTLVSLVAASSGCMRQWWTRGQSCNACPTGAPEYTTAPGVTQYEGQQYLPQPTGS